MSPTLLPALALLGLSLALLPVHADDPDFAPYVLLFDASMKPEDIQATCAAVFAKQEATQFGSERNAILFKPGTYPVQVKIGFYTQVYGLWAAPDDGSPAGLN